jgi:hypothetical protein
MSRLNLPGELANGACDGRQVRGCDGLYWRDRQSGGSQARCAMAPMSGLRDLKSCPTTLPKRHKLQTGVTDA